MACLCFAIKMFAYCQVHKNHLLNLYFIPLIFFFHSCLRVAVACQLLAVRFLINAAASIQ